MDFRPPKPETSLRATGRTDGLPATLRRALVPAADFAPIPVPKPGDWLAEHSETGQTFEDFLGSGSNRPDRFRDKIYLQPLGRFTESRSPPLETLEAYAAAYFAMDVEILTAVAISGSNIRTRINSFSGNRQALTRDILVLLKKGLPPDAFCVLAVTMEDLYPHPSWNFVFGQASFRDRVGLFSFARYDPAFYGERRGKNDQEVLLRRSCKVLTHETAHMFSLAHCIFYTCVMNGSNHLEESDARPFSLCPVCLRKLQFSIGFDVVHRYGKLFLFYRKVGFDREAGWVSNRLKRILGHDSIK